MTIAMPDSIYPGNIPLVINGEPLPAVLGYVDGIYRTADRLPVLFPKARLLTLTVTGKGAVADGCDRETHDLSPAEAAAWLHLRIQAGQWRPVLYASRDNVMAVLAVLGQLGVNWEHIRILSAHYGIGEHICAPATCEAPFEADGTQWTDSFPGINGTKIDMSTLADDFFGDWIFSAPRNLAVLGAGPHSVKVSWDSPGTAAPEAVHHYQLTVRHDGADVGKPVDVPKGPNPQEYQWDNLTPGTPYELMVRAVAVVGHASPWASVPFRTSA